MALARLHAVREGRPGAGVVVLANSVGTTTGVWDAQAAALGEQLGLLRYDHRGHGASSSPPPPWTIADLAADVLALLDELGLPRVSYAGISMGGLVGLQLAATAPERIDRLAVVCSSARFGTAQLWLDRAEQVRREGTQALLEGAAQRWFTPDFRRREPAEAERLLAMLAATPDAGYAACCEALAAADLHPLLPRIAAPTLVIAGRQDPSVPVEQAEAIAAGVQAGRLEVVEAAHLANVEQPAQVTELLRHHVVGAGGRP